jgi:hypothetical protein
VVGEFLSTKPKPNPKTPLKKKKKKKKEKKKRKRKRKKGNEKKSGTFYPLNSVSCLAQIIRVGSFCSVSILASALT